jgi:hypothetical protein
MVDARLKGNVARFVNHSSSDPNLFPQMVFSAGCVPSMLRSCQLCTFELCECFPYDCLSVGHLRAYRRSHIDPKMPAIALFANQDIKPFTELFFDVSYRRKRRASNCFRCYFLAFQLDVVFVACLMVPIVRTQYGPQREDALSNV